MSRSSVRLASGLALLLVVLTASAVAGQVAMPDPKQISGVPLPVADLPTGTVTVLVIRGGFANPLPGVDVTFTQNGRSASTKKTDASGRTQIEGLSVGTALKVTAKVAEETLESQVITIAQSGIRLVLAATDPATVAREAEDRRLAAAAAVKGTVVLGPESRVVVDFADERLNIYYILKVLNTARTPVDIGGPLIFELPQGTRGAAMIEGASKQATANGPRVIVTGPFPPGATNVHVGFELPYSGAHVRFEQRWPAHLQQLTVLAIKTGDLDLSSPQLATKQVVSEQGQPILAGAGPAIPAGGLLVLDITGLPHHAAWPRYVALALAGLVASLGIWAAVFVPGRRASGRG